MSGCSKPVFAILNLTILSVNDCQKHRLTSTESASAC